MQSVECHARASTCTTGFTTGCTPPSPFQSLPGSAPIDATPGGTEVAQALGTSGMPIESALFDAMMGSMRLAVCLTDPNRPDNPIVYVNDAFLSLTGYRANEVMGRNCRFLQGKDTDGDAIDRLTDSLKQGRPALVELVNYRRDGTPFWNALHVVPILGPDGGVRYYFGSQWDVSDVHSARAEVGVARAVARELSHRLRNLFAVAGSIVTLTTRNARVPGVGARINGRLRAMARAHEITINEADGAVRLRGIAEAVLRPFEGRSGGRPTGKSAEKVADEIDVDEVPLTPPLTPVPSPGGTIALYGPDVELPPSSVSVLGLMLNELATNATKYGALRPSGGHVDLRWELTHPPDARRDAALAMRWEETVSAPVGDERGEDGNGDERAAGAGGGTGHAIVERLLRASGGSFETGLSDGAMRARIVLPVPGARLIKDAAWHGEGHSTAPGRTHS